MAFVFILRQRTNRGRAEILAKALKARGLDACCGLDDVPNDIQGAANCAAIDRCAFAVVLWSALDFADAAFADHASYAKSRGKLFALGLDGARLPAALGASIDMLAGWTGDARAPALIKACEAIGDKISQQAAADVWEEVTPFTASAEFAAFERTQKNPTAEALVRFLRQYSGGVFEAIVRAQLDAATRPSYAPVANPAMWTWQRSAETGMRAEKAPEEVWRMSSPGARFSATWARTPKRLRWLLGAGAVLTASVAAIIVLGNLAQTQAARPSSARVVRSAGLELVDSAAPSANALLLGPDSRQNAAAISPSEPVRASRETSAPSSEADGSADTHVAQEIPPAPPLSPASTSTLAPPPERAAPARDAVANADARAWQDARAQNTVASYEMYLSAFPAGVGAAEARASRQRLTQGLSAYDLTQLEPRMRQLVGDARRTEARALVLASRDSRAERRLAGRRNAGAGTYQGQWANSAANGLGRGVWSDGASYAGAWVGSQPAGAGVLRLGDGSRYEGEFAAGAPTGRGVFWDAAGQRMAGGRLFSALIAAR